ncbi:AAA family ATPase [bacterium]|nr:AAA family ATPase [bacterium]
MRIREILISKLFGIFSHKIQLKDKVTIIHSPNGLGKTSLLRLINAVFKNDVAILTSIPFSELKLTFDDGSKITVSKSSELNYKSKPDLNLELKKAENIFSVLLIETQRVVAVEKYSRELVEAIKTKLADYATLSQSLDRTIPKRLLNAKSGKNIPENELRTRFAELEKQRLKVIEAGLLEKDSEEPFKLPSKIDEHTKIFLSVYLQDAEAKLSIFSEMTEKIDLMKKIVNKLFIHKNMKISKEKGFEFLTFDNQLLSLNELSSGEKNEIVLLYELLFKVQKNSLILIDEPELSLHVYWQQEFLKDLLEITSLANIDVIIATHSPQIINDRWDLTVELEGIS